MRKISAEQIQDNWTKLIDTIEGFIDDDLLELKLENIEKMGNGFLVKYTKRNN